jgi:hypothetical protein
MEPLERDVGMNGMCQVRHRMKAVPVTVRFDLSESVSSLENIPTIAYGIFIQIVEGSGDRVSRWQARDRRFACSGSRFMDCGRYWCLGSGTIAGTQCMA